MKAWIMELCPEIQEWQAELIAEEAAKSDTVLLRQCLEALEALHRTGDTQVFDLCYAPKLIPALRERLGE